MSPEDARAVAERIWEDLDDRRGFGLGSLRSEDPEVFGEIMASWVAILAPRAPLDLDEHGMCRCGCGER